eukprot:scaffold46524_cov44-Cyclotella_meneghiniana.AAC.2
MGHNQPIVNNLVTRPGKSKLIPIPLEALPSKQKQGRLLYKAPSSVPSPQHVDGSVQASENELGSRNKRYCTGCVLDYIDKYV